MSQYYSDPARESDKWSLPDVEVFYADRATCATWNENLEKGDSRYRVGWYYWYCFPGCLPEGSQFGPYKTEKAAVEAMRNDAA